MSDRKFVKDVLGGVPQRDLVRFTDLDFASLTGFKTRSSSQATIQTGIQYFTLDTDDPKMKAGCLVQITYDRDCWLWGLVMAKDTTTEPARIKFAALRLSDLILTASDWEIQIVSGPLLGFSPDATIGISSDTITLPSVGQTVSASILANKLVSRNATILFTNATNFESYFRLRVTSYNATTGAVVGVVTASAGTVASYSAWIVQLIPGPVSGGIAAPTTITQVASATGAYPNNYVTVPGTVIAGDIMVLFDYAVDASSAIGFTPTGWTNITGADFASDTGHTRVSAKIATAADISANVVGMSAINDTKRMVLVVFRGDTPAGAFTVSTSIGGEMTDGNPASQSIASAAGTPPLITIGTYGAKGTAAPTRTFTPAADGEVTNHAAGVTLGSRISVKWKIYNSAPADITAVDQDDAGTYNVVHSFYLSLTAVAAIPGDVVVFEGTGLSPKYPAADGSLITDGLGSTLLSLIPTSASQNTMEIGNSTSGSYIAPGRLKYHKTTPKLIAMYTFSSGATSATSITAVDTATEICTTGAAHGLSSGNFIKLTGGTPPTGLTLNAGYYVGVPDTTHLTFHLLKADAIAGTNKINLTAAGSGTRNWVKVTQNFLHNYNLSWVSMVSAVALGVTWTVEMIEGFSDVAFGFWLRFGWYDVGVVTYNAPTTFDTLTEGGGVSVWPAANTTSQTYINMAYGDL